MTEILDNNDPELDIVLECVLHSTSALLPAYATMSSACFDLRADLIRGTQVDGYTNVNSKVKFDVTEDNTIAIPPGFRALVPTNVEFIIPEGYKVLIYARSGLAMKLGLNLANGVGVVDHDYHFPSFVLLHNTSSNFVTVFDKDRIAQAELVPARYCSRLVTIDQRINTTTTREGGMGSTGVQ